MKEEDEEKDEEKDEETDEVSAPLTNTPQSGLHVCLGVRFHNCGLRE